MLVKRRDIERAQSLIQSCQHCTYAQADLPFDALLDTITGCDVTTAYVMEAPAKCPGCLREIFQKTLIVPLQ
jgi:hypothetical protein